MPSRRDELVIEYLARLQVGLLGMPRKEREEAYRELAQHVEELVADTAGDGEDGEAVRAALQKFGEPEKIGRKVANDYWRNAIRDDALLRYTSSPLVVLLVNGVTWFVVMALNIGHSLPNPSSPYLMPLLALCGVPLGIITGGLWAWKALSPDSATSRKSKARRWMDHHAVACVAVISILILFLLICELVFPQIADRFGRSAACYTVVIFTDYVVAIATYRYCTRGRNSALTP